MLGQRAGVVCDYSKIEAPHCRLTSPLQRTPADIYVNLILPEIDPWSTLLPLTVYAFLYLFSRSCFRKHKTPTRHKGMKTEFNVKWSFKVMYFDFRSQWKACNNVGLTTKAFIDIATEIADFNRPSVVFFLLMVQFSLHSTLRIWHRKMHYYAIDYVMTVQGHPRSSMSTPIKSAYAAYGLAISNQLQPSLSPLAPFLRYSHLKEKWPLFSTPLT